jgi:hypothetical protein
MQALRLTLPVALTSLTLGAFAVPALPAAPTDAQRAFERLKALTGKWHASITGEPTRADMGNGTYSQVTIRVTSRGHALVLETQEIGKPDDPTRYDHPLTMLYLSGDSLMLTHYCDAGNRPRMAGKVSRDGKTVEFDFLDIAGTTELGYMRHVVFTFIDANHHTEDWTYMLPNDKPFRAHFDLWRITDGSGS